jgi:hypothetical protein
VGQAGVISVEFRRFVDRQIDRALTALEKRLTLAIAAGKPRKAEFNVTNLAAGATTTVDVTWSVPIPSNYVVDVSPTTSATFVGLVSGTVQAGSKTTTGCTVIVANRHPSQTIAAAAFDALATPL